MRVVGIIIKDHAKIHSAEKDGLCSDGYIVGKDIKSKSQILNKLNFKVQMHLIIYFLSREYSSY